MKILVDTNVLISAMVFDGRVLRLLKFLIEACYDVLVSEYVDNEFHDKLLTKWPSKAEEIYTVLHNMNFIFCSSTQNLSGTLRDPDDIPVLSDAIYHNADIILTGDKDFLEAGIAQPLIYSPSMLADLLRIR